MKLVKSLLLGSAAGIVAVASAQAADLPTRKAAPVEYVRICDVYGAGFFYIPGTDTCLKVGGLGLFEIRDFVPTKYSIGTAVGKQVVGSINAAGVPTYVAGSAINNAGSAGAVGTRSPKSRDLYGTAALARIELDARDQTAFGTLRTFLRVDSTYGSASTSATGSLGGLSQTNQLPLAQKELTYVNKAFIQFAGFTAGRAQSQFDFYADAYNFETLRGSNATTTLLSYTATFGGGFSATISAEDEVARRNLIGNVATAFVPQLPGVAIVPSAGGAYSADDGGTRVPDFVGALRIDQAWGSAQLSGAAHEVRAEQFGANFLNGPNAGTANPGAIGTLQNSSNKYGFAAQAGVKINLPFLSPGDNLYLQATYERGATGYITGNNLAFVEGGDNARHGGVGLAGAAGAFGFNRSDYDCVFVQSGRCDLQSGFAVTGALLHFWSPQVRQALFGSYMNIRYSGAARNPLFTTGVTNSNEFRVGSNIIYSPVKNFDIGVEAVYLRYHNDTPANFNNGTNLAGLQTGTNSSGIPFQNNQGQFETRLRILRAF